MKRAALALAVAVGLSSGLAFPARAGDHATVDDVRTALKNAHASQCTTQRAEDVFDQDEIARRALGRHWRDRTHAERAELVKLLHAHVLGWYSRLCQRQELLHFESSVVNDQRATLSARAIREGHAVSVLYRLRSPDGTRWLVYDVEISGRSHVRALYGEIDRILLNEGYRDLVARLAAEQDAPLVARTP